MTFEKMPIIHFVKICIGPLSLSGNAVDQQSDVLGSIPRMGENIKLNMPSGHSVSPAKISYG